MRISDWSSDVCSSDLQTQACGPCWAARLISASSWQASGAGSCSGKSLNTRWSELVVTHEHIAYGVDETQHDGQRRKEIEDDQKDDAPAYLILIKTMGTQPAQADRQHNGELAMAMQFIQFVAHVLDDTQCAGSGSRKGAPPLGPWGPEGAFER